MQNNHQNNPDLSGNSVIIKSGFWTRIGAFFKHKTVLINEETAKSEAFRAEQSEIKAVTGRKDWMLILVTLSVIALYGSAIFFAFQALDILRKAKDTPNIDWHILLVVTSFLIPPTLLMYATIKGVYSGYPKSTKRINEISTPIADAVSSGSEATKNLVDAATLITEQVK